MTGKVAGGESDGRQAAIDTERYVGNPACTAGLENRLDITDTGLEWLERIRNNRPEDLLTLHEKLDRMRNVIFGVASRSRNSHT